MKLKEFIAKLEEISKVHGGDIPVEVVHMSGFWTLKHVRHLPSSPWVPGVAAVTEKVTLDGEIY